MSAVRGAQIDLARRKDPTTKNSRRKFGEVLALFSFLQPVGRWGSSHTLQKPTALHTAYNNKETYLHIKKSITRALMDACTQRSWGASWAQKASQSSKKNHQHHHTTIDNNNNNGTVNGTVTNTTTPPSTTHHRLNDHINRRKTSQNGTTAFSPRDKTIPQQTAKTSTAAAGTRAQTG